MQISIAELKNNVEKYIEMAEQQDIVIVQDGKQVAKIGSASVSKASALESILHEALADVDVDIEMTNQDSKYGRLYPVLNAVASLVGLHSGKEQGYAKRMKHYLEIIVDALQERDSYKQEVSSWDKNLFLLSAQLHDVGETAVHGHFLKKAGELTSEEYNEIKAHTDLGIKIVQQAKENLELGSLFQYAEIVAGSHHEKWDGSGYPQGLKADKIPLQGRIMAIVDVYDALTTVRPHREKKTHQ
ncbi:MAG: HD domain-containing protein, partial [Defluviitaleaceae bacterium]|nr:HD domain-containing protein [Defluviitaleaceae bacterium]